MEQQLKKQERLKKLNALEYVRNLFKIFLGVMDFLDLL